MKLIITDLDNTLLRSDKSISPYTVQILEKCRTKGWLIAFATARGRAVSRFVETIKPDIIIANGGATVTVNGEVIYRDLLSEEDVQIILSMSQAFTNGTALISVENDDGYYCNFVPDDPDRKAVFTYDDFYNFRAPAYKVSPELESDEWAESIEKACKNCSLLNFAGEKWRRFAARDSSKETAIKALTDHLGISLNDVIAFGDDYNDLGMLKMAGTSVAVANAIDEVKQVADYITESNNDDGVAKFLEKMILS